MDITRSSSFPPGTPDPIAAEFKIPADWWNEAGMFNFERQSAFYAYQDLPELFIRMEAIEVPSMEGRQHLEHGGLNRVRMVSVLYSIVSRSDTAFPYRLHHGIHRFFASVAAGFQFHPRCYLALSSPTASGLG